MIPYDIGTDFVRFATISQKQYNYLKYLSEQNEGGFNKSHYERVLDGFLEDNSKEILAYTLSNDGKNLEETSAFLDENDLLKDIFSLNDLEIDTVRLNASTIKQLFDDTNIPI